MQHWTEVLFNSGINILGKGVSREDNPQSGSSSTAIDNTRIAVVTTMLDEDWCVMVRKDRGRHCNTMNYSLLYFN